MPVQLIRDVIFSPLLVQKEKFARRRTEQRPFRYS